MRGTFLVLDPDSSSPGMLQGKKQGGEVRPAGNLSVAPVDVLGRHVLVVGLGRTGLATVRLLRSKGAFVTVSDLRPPSVFQDVIGELINQQVTIELGQHTEATFCYQDWIVVSPGVDPKLTALHAARERGIPIFSEVETASWFLGAPIVGITGSNGKTTTTFLLGEILVASGFPVQVGGNIGTPLISQVESSNPKGFSVVELSSFQLEAIVNFRPSVAVLLNLTPDHLDRHGSFEEYVAVKVNIFRNQTSDDFSVLNADDPEVMAVAKSLCSSVVFFSRKQELLEGVFVQDGEIIYRKGNLECSILAIKDVQILGKHNLENVLAAVATACVLGADLRVIGEVTRRFRGVEHRLEFVRQIRDVSFYNDSKATNVEATSRSIDAFDHGVHLILGGKGKGSSFLPLRRSLEGKVKRTLLIGSAAERIAADISGVGEVVHCGDLGKAVREAFQGARSGDTVLLAPACASYDQFQNFEHRGRFYKETILDLAREIEPDIGKGIQSESWSVTPQEVDSSVSRTSHHAPQEISDHKGKGTVLPDLPEKRTLDVSGSPPNPGRKLNKKLGNKN